VAQRDIGCEDCGAVLPMEISSIKLDKPNLWHPGKHCPMCGSEKFFPIIAVTETDRRQEEPAPLKRRVLMNPWTGIAALAVTIIVVLGIVLWPRSAADSGEKVLFLCDKCGEIFEEKKGSTPPVKCPKCNERAGHRAAVCVQCSNVYSYEAPQCPHCKTKPRRPLESADELAKARKTHAEYLKREELENDEYEQ